MQPICPHCKSTNYTWTKVTRGGVKIIIIYCKDCGAILAAANDK
jgi:uncharacterized OB-fold protein